MKSEALEFWKQNAIKTFVMFGFTYFGIAFSLGDWALFKPSLFAAFFYFFTELARYYGIHSMTKTVTASVKSKKHFSFLI